MEYALAVDIGGTQASIATVSRDFEILQKRIVPTGSALNLWSAFEGAIRDLLASTSGNLIGVGIGSAGPLDLRQGRISPVNISDWREFPIVAKFQELTDGAEVVLHGDGMALADAEFQLGAGRNVRNMLGMVVSTGVGGGLIIDGKLVLGESGNASYFGHHSISHKGELCACGRTGCLESYASGPSMVKFALRAGWKSEDESFIALAEAARAGDSIALTAIDQGAHALAVGIVNVCAITDVDVVVIGGGVAQAGEIYWLPLINHIKVETSQIDFLKGIDLRRAELSRDAGLLGAALGVMRVR